MTVLAKIRGRAGLLVAIIGIALLTFILQSALESGNYFFSSNDNSVGQVAGQKISYEEFSAKVQKASEGMKKRMNVSTLEQGVTDRIVDDEWEGLLKERIMNSEFEKLGIVISADELTDAMLGPNPHPYTVQYFTDKQTGKIIDAFVNPATGQLNMQKVLEYNQGMKPEEEADWVMLEEVIRKVLLEEKYNNIVKKGIYVTSSEAKSGYVEENKLFSLRYTVKKYFTVPDSSIKVTEDEMKAYYTSHQQEFKNPLETRSCDYIVFNAEPSDEDMKALITDVTRIRDDFAKNDPKDDSSFVIRESDVPDYDNVFLKKGQVSEAVDSIVFKDSIPKGFVVGPYSENNAFKVTKLIDKTMASDSAKASHILISCKGAERAGPNVTRSPEQAKSRADSLFKILKAADPKKLAEVFKEMAKTQNDDMAAAEKEGDLGWMSPGGTMDPTFMDKCFFTKKGEVAQVITKFGFHIVYVTEKGTETPRVKVATVKRAIIPSTNTLQQYNMKASEFAGKNSKAELFDKAAAELKMTPRKAENIKENDRTIGGLEQPKPLVYWMYEAKIGDISDVLQFENKFVVAKLTTINEKGILPMDKVRPMVETGARQEKKASMFAAEMEKALVGSTKIEDVGAKANLPVQNSENFSFASAAVIGLGKEGELAGIISNCKKGVLTKPVKGKSGVFVAVVEEIKEAPATTDYKMIKSRLGENVQGRVDYEVFEALKENANIIDRRAKQRF